MQSNPSEIPLAQREPPCGEPAKLWLEQEDPEEVKKIEEQKKKQKALEDALAEERRKQKGQKEAQARAN